MPKVRNRNESDIPRNAVYIGRPGKWGNPYIAGIDGTRKEVIEKYRMHLYASGLIHDLHEITGKDLVCWCKPKACHGDVLIELANPSVLATFFEE